MGEPCRCRRAPTSGATASPLRVFRGLVLEDDQDTEVLVRGEAMLGLRLYEDGAALSDRYLVTFHVEYACALEDDIQLIVLVGLLPIRLRGDEHVDPDFEADGLVDDLVATAGLTEPFLDGCDLERVQAANLLHPHGQA